MVDLGERVVTMGLVIACQAIDLRKADPLGKGTRTAYERVRELVGFMAEGDAIPGDLERLRGLVRSGELRLPSP
jgi:histidine ammonia-lyase